MDPYLTLGVPRGCSRQEVKEAFRVRVQYAHPDHGGEALSFVQLRAAYEQILAELDQNPGPGLVAAGPGPTDGHAATTTMGPGVGERPYESWVRYVAAQSSRRRSVWQSRPVRVVGVTVVLLLIAMNVAVCLMLWTAGSRVPSAAPPEPVPGEEESAASPVPIRYALLPKRARRWQRPPAHAADFFLIPYDATLFVAPVVIEGGPTTEFRGRTAEFGIVLPRGDLLPIFTGLPNHPHPAREIEIGPVSQGSRLRVYLKQGDSWVFSDATSTKPWRKTFSDRDNSLGGRGSIIEKTSSKTWVLHLDDLDSDDDDDDDIFIQIRLEPPEE